MKYISSLMASSFIYLLGCFYNTSFDIISWTSDSRFCVAIAAGFSAMVIVMTIYLDGTEK